LQRYENEVKWVFGRREIAGMENREMENRE